MEELVAMREVDEQALDMLSGERAASRRLEGVSLFAEMKRQNRPMALTCFPEHEYSHILGWPTDSVSWSSDLWIWQCGW